MTTATIPTASQLYMPNLKNKIVRQGWCPVHGSPSSKWLGVQPNLFDDGEAMWVFRCAQPHAMNDANFLNHVDPYAPKLGQEEAWVRAQMEARTQEAIKGKKKAGQ